MDILKLVYQLDLGFETLQRKVRLKVIKKTKEILFSEIITSGEDIILQQIRNILIGIGIKTIPK